MGRLKRFRIWHRDGIQETTVLRCDTILEVIEWCNNNQEMVLIDNYMVECLIDEIEIQADELIEAWARGERPCDLQMF